MEEFLGFRRHGSLRGLVRRLRMPLDMSTKANKDGWGDKLRAAERARENLYFAKVDEELLAKIREKEAQAKLNPEAEGDCPRCRKPLRSGLWRDLQIEFCPGCGGLWLDPGDLLQLVEREELDLQLVERTPDTST